MPADKKAKTSYSAGQATRELILNVATEMLAEVGYYGITLRDLARRIGISHPAVIYHFPNKEAMVNAAITRFEEACGIVEVSYDEESGELTPVRLIPQNYVEYALQLMRMSDLEQLNPILAFSAIIEYEAVKDSHPLYRYAQARRNLMADFLTSELMRLKADGTWQSSVEPMFISQTILTLWAGSVYHSRVRPCVKEETNCIIAFIATTIVLLKIAPSELLDFSGRVPEELSNVYMRIMRLVANYME